jgi:cytochrome c oxidase subunit II
MQDVAWTLSLIFMALIAAVFLWIVAGAGTAVRSSGQSGMRWRSRLFWLSMVVGIVISFVTLWDWPIAGHAAAMTKPDVVIRAVGHQWRWDLDRDTVKAGELVEFEVTATDVNHGFAIYRDKHHMVAQAQAMPGYVNRLRVRFSEPGDYEVLCLEYCGLAHHNMRVVIKVTGAPL